MQSASACVRTVGRHAVELMPIYAHHCKDLGSTHLVVREPAMHYESLFSNDPLVSPRGVAHFALLLWCVRRNPQHFALKAAGIDSTLLGAFDINTNANLVYKHNFTGVQVTQRSVSQELHTYHPFHCPKRRELVGAEATHAALLSGCCSVCEESSCCSRTHAIKNTDLLRYCVHQIRMQAN
jgi:hypothetical protein